MGPAQVTLAVLSRKTAVKKPCAAWPKAFGHTGFAKRLSAADVSYRTGAFSTTGKKQEARRERV